MCGGGAAALAAGPPPPAIDSRLWKAAPCKAVLPATHPSLQTTSSDTSATSSDTDVEQITAKKQPHRVRDAAKSAVLAVTAIVALGWAGQHVWGWVQDRLEDSRAEAPEMRRRRLMIRWLRHHLPVAELVDWLDSGLLGGAMRGLFLPVYSAIFERELRQAIPGGKAAAGCVFATGMGVWAAGRAGLLEPSSALT